MRGATNAMQRMWRVQQMQTGGATNVKRGVQQMRWGATNVAVQRMRMGCNECDTTNTTTGATDARSGVHKLCLGRGVQVTQIQSGSIREC